MLTVAILSMKGDSLTMDELAHIPSGYGYMHEKDYRLNPEHPPLLKDLAAIPLLFMDLKFDKEFGAWKNDVNGQWTMGWKFIFASGNNPEKIIFWSRIPIILILLILGFYIFRWTKELFGTQMALLAIFLFSFSPTFIAHSRYVTTDVGAAAAFFIATYYFVKWLQLPTKKNLIIAGIVFGIAQLIKFSLFLLLVYFSSLLLIWIIINKKRFWNYLGKFILILVIGYLLILPVYQYHVLNYPPERQSADAKSILASYGIRPLASLVVWMADKPILRTYSQYLLGLLMVFQRSSGGNTTYFLGEVNNQAWYQYFPIVYAIKEPLALHVLTIIALLFLAWPVYAKASTGKQISKYFPEISMLIFLAIYWVLSIKSNLNIGIRHILPTFPFVYVLISGQIKRIFNRIENKKTLGFCVMVLGILIAWYAVSSLSCFPYYLAYFNELAGGAKNGYKYVVDSNLDWGQDLKRLAKWLDENKIEKIKVDYFGGGDTKYYLGDKYEPWHGNWLLEQAKGNWLAVSATALQSGRGLAAPGFNQPTGYYRWLNSYEPVAVIGHSIFVYYIK
jgi:hypothetical protein